MARLSHVANMLLFVAAAQTVASQTTSTTAAPTTTTAAPTTTTAGPTTTAAPTTTTAAPTGSSTTVAATTAAATTAAATTASPTPSPTPAPTPHNLQPTPLPTIEPTTTYDWEAPSTTQKLAVGKVWAITTYTNIDALLLSSFDNNATQKAKIIKAIKTAYLEISALHTYTEDDIVVDLNTGLSTTTRIFVKKAKDALDLKKSVHYSIVGLNQHTLEELKKIKALPDFFKQGKTMKDLKVETLEPWLNQNTKPSASGPKGAAVVSSAHRGFSVLIGAVALLSSLF